jgi:hypothetical protein
LTRRQNKGSPGTAHITMLIQKLAIDKRTKSTQRELWANQRSGKEESKCSSFDQRWLKEVINNKF